MQGLGDSGWGFLVTKKQAGARQADLSDTLSHSADPLPPSSLRDARAVRSAQALGNALLALIERKPLEQVTVREIAAEAGVHYATFFRHHPTKEALLDHLAAEQISRLVALALPALDLEDTLAAFTTLCDYVNEHRVLWTALLTGGAAGTLRTELLRIARELAVTHARKENFLPVELAVNCSVSLIFETLAWWLAQAPGTVTQAQVARMLEFQLAAIQQPGPK
jgi:AcrR family transcriptional regulator